MARFRDRLFGALGYVPVVVVSLIILTIYAMAVLSYIAGREMRASAGLAVSVLHLAIVTIFHVFFVMTVINYGVCIVKDPGYVPKHWHPSAALRDDAIEDQFSPRRIIVERDGVVHGRAADFRTCATCEGFKPERSHHCSTCSRCVLRMDHHCVFINNCVGAANQKNFFLFVLYGMLGSCTGVVMGLSVFHSLLLHPENSSLSIFGPGRSTETVAGFTVVVGWLLAVTMTFTLFIFVSFHIFLISRNRTTIDTMIPSTAGRSHDLGTLENLRSTLGPSPAYWLCPFSAPVPREWMQVNVGDMGDASV